MICGNKFAAFFNIDFAVMTAAIIQLHYASGIYCSIESTAVIGNIHAAAIINIGIKCTSSA